MIDDTRILLLYNNPTNITAAWAVDREFVYIEFGSLVVLFWSLWGALGVPLAVLGHLGGPFGAPWAPGGPCGSPIRCQARFGDLASAEVW